MKVKDTTNFEEKDRIKLKDEIGNVFEVLFKFGGNNDYSIEYLLNGTEIEPLFFRRDKKAITTWEFLKKSLLESKK